ncbi:hypothetical protein FOZ62_032225 [Perkinsus olseni]|uniref:Tyr recombinase domain-containing protein n=1 Tax=Perkinsus olseni TaxID=32597 RepID=A0A7J6QGX6_PEROL|nr:hypothetical protein FOZ62_032225 [Perkinsus olseni]
MALVAILAYSLRVESELLAVTIDDISLTREYVALRLKKRKNVPQGETILRYCTCSSNSLLCPVEAAKISVELHSTLRVQSPLLFGSVSYRSILVHLRSILSALHVKDSSEYGTHAFRRGHAHALASSGSSHEELCRAGSWRYKSAVPARIYADFSEIEAIACRQALPDILESDSESDDD